MAFQFPFPATPVLQEALDIAMNYLASARQAFPYSETERLCVNAIYSEWMAGRRHRIWLANKAIVAVEQAKKGEPTLQVVPITASGTEG